MECDVCGRPFSAQRQPNCTSCARSNLYEQRIQQATALLDREKVHNHAEAVVRPGNDGVIASLAEDANWDAITSALKRHSVEKGQAEREVIELKIDDIVQKAVELRQQIEGYQEYISKQKEVHAKRRRDLGLERKQLESQKPRLTDPLLSAIRKSGQKHAKVHTRTVDARAVLCQEASTLSGLHKVKGKDGRSEYWLGGITVPDLRDFNSKINLATETITTAEYASIEPHEIVSASLDNVCRLLGNCCHYLSIRLPSEVILPHNDFPYSMILPEKSSYKCKEPSYRSLSSSLSASRLLDRNAVPRPRPLHLDRPLAQLLKEDSKAFRLFVEGVMLLAWDVAWLCRTQGVTTINSFDEVCALGKNLHLLLVAQESRMPPKPTPARLGAPASDKEDRVRSTAPTPAAYLGAFSHGSVNDSLASADGQALLRGWRLNSPARLMDKLKSYLLTEISGAEWDFVEDEEWDEEREDEKAVLVGGVRRSLDKAAPIMSVMTVAADDGARENPLKPVKGNNGWMKLRGRGGGS